MQLKLLLLLAIIFYYGCESSTEGLPVFAGKKLSTPLTLENYASFQFDDTLKVYFGDTLSNSDENIWITFDSLLNDSRCPINVVCIWEGNAEVSILVSNNEYIRQVRLNTFPDFKYKKDVFGYNISLIDVMPFPHTDSLYVEENYCVKIIVKNVP